MTAIPDRLAVALAARYRLERELGQGGMATVYLARDLRHDRDVAIKVLRPELAAVIGAQRFLTEIKTTANLQHPHILPLHDSGEVNGTVYYVMPFVEGESLRDRLTREKQLPIADALRITTEVAAALDYAHRHGVIHRDIKPENILLHDGSALVADFGIALAVSNTADTRMTETGMSLGTPHYMSPEQAMGERDLDARTDVYALGCVLYEALAGEPPFTGPTAQAIVAKVMTATPEPVTTYRKTVPPAIEDAVHTALQKLPADRFASARDFVEALTSPMFAARSRVASRGDARRTLPSWIVWASAALAAAALGVAAWSRLGAPMSPASRFAIALPRSQRMGLAMQGTHIAVSRDGAIMVYTGGDSVSGRLWVKPRDALTATSIPGTEGAYDPFISPDKRSVGFFTDRDGRIMKVVSLVGGPARTITGAPLGNSGADWATDGYIYFDADVGGLARIRPDGTGRETVAPLDTAQHETGIAWPQVLPGSRTVMMRLRHGDDLPTDFTIIAVRIQTGERATIARGVSALYTKGRLLVVAADGTVQVAPFSERQLTLTGPLTPVLTDVRIAGNYSGVDLALSGNGTLYYLAGASGAGARLEWVDRSGNRRPVDPDWHEDGDIRGVALSPDGTETAVEISHVGTTGTDIWVKQLPTGPLFRLTLDPAPDSRPSFSGNGTSILFLGERVSPMAVFRRSADGAGRDSLLAAARRDITEAIESRDGRWLVARTSSASAGSGDILAMQFGRDSVLRPIIATPASESNPALSPDGHWLAYVSTASGRREVYVRPFPNVNDGLWQASTDGGVEPRWAHSGNELFFRSTRNQNLIVAEVETTPVFRVRSLHALFRLDAAAGLDYVRYDISPDDQRFLVVGRADAEPQLIRIERFIEHLTDRTAP